MYDKSNIPIKINKNNMRVFWPKILDIHTMYMHAYMYEKCVSQWCHKVINFPTFTFSEFISASVNRPFMKPVVFIT